MSTEDIFADVKRDGTPLADLLQEEVTESQPEESPEEQQPAEGDVPAEETLAFHKHPRWIQREQELEELRARDGEREAKLAEFESRLAQIPKSESTDIPDWFSELYGDNQVAWNKYSEHEQARTNEIEQRILNRQREAYANETRENDRWAKWVDDEMQRLVDDGLSFDKNVLTKIMLEYRPTDHNNNLDFDAGYKIYSALNKTDDNGKSEARRQLADTVASTSHKGEATKKDYLTSNDLRNRSMMSL